MAQRILQAETREAEVETPAVAGSVEPALQAEGGRSGLGTPCWPSPCKLLGYNAAPPPPHI